MLRETIANHWESLDMVQQGIAQGTIYGMAQGIAQGKQLGKEEGRIEGYLEALGSIMLLLVKTRFPAIANIANQRAIHIKDPELLKALVDSLIMTKNEGDALLLLTAAIAQNNNEFATSK
jgi:flagellar biosynthesis/type III secretory pathway protein FliH